MLLVIVNCAFFTKLKRVLCGHHVRPAGPPAPETRRFVGISEESYVSFESVQGTAYSLPKCVNKILPFLFR